MLPDPELLLATHLRAQPAITGITDRIGTRTPPITNEPWIRITLLPVTPAPSSRALHLATALLQVDCYAGHARDGAQEQASILARTVQDAIHRMPGRHAGAVIASARASYRRLPDADLEPARERYIVEAQIVLHSAP